MTTDLYSVQIASKKSGYPPGRLAWTLWGFCAAFYLIGFYQRVAPGVMTRELMADFGISAAALGNLSAFYFYSYVAMQVPTGILADTLGPRRLLAGGALITGVGSLLFALSPTILWANLGRFMIGGAVAVAFVGMLKLASHWLAPRRFALASGLALFVGVIGAVSAGVPLQLLIAAYGWRPVMAGSAVLPFVIGMAIWIFVRDDPQERGYASYGYQGTTATSKSRYSIVAGLQAIFRYRNTWLLFLIPGSIVGAVLTFSGLWGVPFLTTHYDLQPAQAAALSSTLLVAWAVGGTLFGGLSDRIGRRKLLYVGGCAAVALGWGLIIFIPNLPIPLLVVLFVATGLASGCMAISFAYVKESVPTYLAGTAIGVINMGIMLGPTLLQPAVGWTLDWRWQGGIAGGVRVYSLAAYQAGFSLMLAWLVLALVLIVFTSETYCRQVG